MADETHYCKHCSTWFRIDLGNRASGDFFLRCPECGWDHYRHFALGEAIHCEISKRDENPRTIQGRRL